MYCKPKGWVKMAQNPNELRTSNMRDLFWLNCASRAIQPNPPCLAYSQSGSRPLIATRRVCGNKSKKTRMGNTNLVNLKISLQQGDLDPHLGDRLPLTIENITSEF